MKKILLLLFIFISILCKSQDTTYSISIRFNNDTSKIYVTKKILEVLKISMTDDYLKISSLIIDLTEDERMMYEAILKYELSTINIKQKIKNK